MLESGDGINFADFNYVVSLAGYVSSHNYRPIQLPLALCVIHAIDITVGTQGILVYDTEMLLARYDSRSDDGMLMDSVSGTGLADIGQHLQALKVRIDEF